MLNITVLKHNIKSIDCFDTVLCISWVGGEEEFYSLRALRQSCPCAFCSGETDVFGNKYIGDKKKPSDKGVILKGYSFVGLYALRFIWGDGHSDGLYTFDLLKNISSNYCNIHSKNCNIHSKKSL